MKALKKLGKEKEEVQIPPAMSNPGSPV